MFNFLKKKRKLSNTVNNIVKKNYNTINKDDLYNPSYEQIVEDFMWASKDNVYKISYERAYIDNSTKKMLISEGYTICESYKFGMPRLIIMLNTNK